MYIIQDQIRYYSARYAKWVHVEPHFQSDGATFAIDISGPIEVFDTKKYAFVSVSKAWIIHDKLKKTKMFVDGSTCTNFQASTILSDILKLECRWIRARSWWVATYLWGEFISIIFKIRK